MGIAKCGDLRRVAGLMPSNSALEGSPRHEIVSDATMCHLN
jgi:hypothetical protein